MLQDGNLMANDAYSLGGVRTLAKLCGIDLGARPTEAEIQDKLFPVWGTEKAFIENAPAVAAALKLDGAVIPDEQTLLALVASGGLDEIRLRNTIGPGMPRGPVTIIYRGAVANWMERGVREGHRNVVDTGLQPAATFLIASNRVCDRDSELTNSFVRQYYGRHRHYPTEAELLPVIVEAITGYEREVHYIAPDQAEQVRALITGHPELAHGRIYVPTNANATFVPLQIRRVIREQYPIFDENTIDFWFSQDGFALATTPEQAADTANFQRPLTVFSGLVRLINELYMLQNS